MINLDFIKRVCVYCACILVIFSLKTFEFDFKNSNKEFQKVSNKNYIQQNKIQNEFIYERKDNNEITDSSYENKIDENIWRLEIPKIELYADINEGTSEEILNKYVGHFEETSICDGNVGLAGHNRGYPVNYFARLKELEIGDLIYYIYKGKKSEYRVELKEIIQDTNWNFLEPTKENKLTLITCVEDKPSLRRCIQAIEQK